jgi:spore coat polysaccharide biosynthesis protein SpsF
MKTIAIIQARMNSSRLPGKVMADICGKPLIDYVVERVNAAMGLDDVIVASPKEDFRGPLHVHSTKRGWCHYWKFRPERVADRFAAVLSDHPCDRFVRICADSPLIDFAVINEALATHAEKDCIYSIVRAPTGCAEVMDTELFLDMVNDGPLSDEEQEHVLGFVLKTNIGVTEKVYRADSRFVVDTQDDLDRVRGVVSRMTKPHTEYGWQECLSLA